MSRHIRMKLFGDGHVEELITETPAPRREDAAGERVARIAARLKAATPGPWAYALTEEKGYGACVGAGCYADDGEATSAPLSGDLTLADEYFVEQPICELHHQGSASDAEFIAHSRSDVEYLLAALSTAEREQGANTLSADDVEALRYCVTTAEHCVRMHATSATYVAVMGKLARAYDVLARVPSGGEEGR